MEYNCKIERITHDDDPKLYALEETIHEAFREVLKHREKKYKEDYWREALPTELFSFLDGWDRKAVKEAISKYQLFYK